MINYAVDRLVLFVFFFQEEGGIRYLTLTGFQTCALPIFEPVSADRRAFRSSSSSRSRKAAGQRRLARAARLGRDRSHDRAQIGRTSGRERVEACVVVARAEERLLINVAVHVLAREPEQRT